MLKVAIFNFKGGTGKSTTALNLGACLATSKRKVLLIDLDGQRTLSFGLGKDGELPTTNDWLLKGKVQPVTTAIKNLWLIPGDLDLFDLKADADLFTPALAQLTEFDVCLMDCSPGLGVASVQSMLTSDRILNFRCVVNRSDRQGKGVRGGQVAVTGGDFNSQVAVEVGGRSAAKL